MIKVISVVGARPNFMKAAPVKHAFDSLKNVTHLLLHTGQHYDAAMSDIFFEELGMGKPDLYLGVGSGSHAEQTAKIMIEFEKVCIEQKPNLVIVYGDVNSTLAASIVAKKLNIKVAHVESGLRSFDREMPEEINRIVTDSITDLFFVTEESGRTHLLHDGKKYEQIFFVGNTMIDTLVHFCTNNSAPQKGNYFVLTLHRPSNVDNHEHLKALLQSIEDGAGDCEIYFPVHPRTMKTLKDSGIINNLNLTKWKLLDPAGYKDFITMVRGAKGVVTDSGGIQEETTWLGVPCITLRGSTERPSTVELGTNTLIGIEPQMVKNAVSRIATNTAQNLYSKVPPLWDGRAAERIVNIIMRELSLS